MVSTDMPGLSHRSREQSRSSNQDRPDVPQMPSSFNTPEKRDVILDFAPESEAELVECLETYRNDMVPYFPIVCIDAGVTAAQLKKERPFLYLVIRAICSKNLWRQAVLILQVKRVLGKQMLLEGEKSLDPFLGVLVFASWSHLYICNNCHYHYATWDLACIRSWTHETASCRADESHAAFNHTRVC